MFKDWNPLKGKSQTPNIERAVPPKLEGRALRNEFRSDAAGAYATHFEALQKDAQATRNKITQVARAIKAESAPAQVMDLVTYLDQASELGDREQMETLSALANQLREPIPGV